MKTLLIATLLSLGLHATAQATPQLQLAHRIEVEPTGDGVRLQACHFMECSLIGIRNFSKGELEAALAKVKSSDPITKAILKSAIEGKASTTFANLQRPYVKKGVKYSSTLGAGDNGFATVLTPTVKNDTSQEKDFVYGLSKETAGQFQFFESPASVDQIQKSLLKSLQ
jgi:hypothetical protein